MEFLQVQYAEKIRLFLEEHFDTIHILSFKERIFCIIAYLPKATVQSAKAGIPLKMGVAGGEIMQALAILSVLITAPIGAIGIRLTSPIFLNQGVTNKKSQII